MAIPRTLFAFILGLLLVVFLQSVFPVFQERPLSGDIKVPEKPAFSWETWMDGSYQTREENFFNESFGFRNTFVRIGNQIDYSLFGLMHAKDVIEGKEGYLYELNYLKAASGSDYKGKQFLEESVSKFKTIQDRLREKNIDIILVLVPGKASFFPEYIPDQYLIKKDTTNYSMLVALSEQYGIHMLDLNACFSEKKKSSPYPLYPQYGIHWSMYGSVVAFDTLLKYIEQLRNIDLPDLKIKNIEQSTTTRGTDADIAEGLNLLISKKSYALAYPEVQFETAGKSRLDVLTIGDSYYWTFFGTGMSGQAFENSGFWYFYAQHYTDGSKEIKERYELNLKEELEKQDVVLLFITESNYQYMGWGIIEDAYAIMGSDSVLAQRKNRIHEIEESIRETPEWFKAVKEKARLKEIPLDSMIYLDAKYVYDQEKAGK